MCTAVKKRIACINFAKIVHQRQLQQLQKIEVLLEQFSKGPARDGQMPGVLRRVLHPFTAVDEGSAIHGFELVEFEEECAYMVQLMWHVLRPYVDANCTSGKLFETSK